MGVRGELFSTTVSLQNRTYFFNVKENRMGDLYLNIVESKNRETGGFDRQSVILFADDLREFLSGFDESLRVLEKAVREKKKNAPDRGRGDHRKEARGGGSRGDGARGEGGQDRPRLRRKPRDGDAAPAKRGRRTESGDAPAREKAPVKRGKRVVVKKREE